MNSKASLLFLTTFLVLASFTAEAQKVTIADDNFLQALIKKGYDSNNDKQIQIEEARSVKVLLVNNIGITSLEGVQYFDSLVELSCSGNKLTGLDLSKNKQLRTLKCYNNSIQNLQLPASIVEVNCRKNNLTELDLSVAKQLKTLDCSWNKLEKLDLRKNQMLENVVCKNNQITDLIIDNSALLKLDCKENQIKMLNPDRCKAIQYLFVQKNHIQSLRVQDLSALISVNLEGNKLKKLQVDNCGKLETLICNKNELTEFSISESPLLKKLDCSENQLKKLVLPKLLHLQTLNVFSNQLEVLELNSPVSLQSVNCSKNNLSALDLSLAFRMTRLDCMKNPALKDVFVTDTARAFLRRYTFLIDQTQRFVQKTFKPIVFDENLAENWTSEFGGDRHDGVTKSNIATEVPILKWKIPVGSSSFIAPLIYRNVVYLLTQRGNLLALNGSDASVLWVTEALGNDCVATPTLSDGKIYVSGGDTFTAVDIRTGKVVWQHALDPDRLSSVPAVADDLVIATSFDYVLAFDKNTGEIKWKYFTGTQIYDGKRYKGRLCSKRSAPPVVSDGKIIVGNAFEPELYCLDLKTGEEIWKYSHMEPFYARPLVDEGVVYVGDGRGEFHVVDLKTGTQEWTLNLRNFDGLEFATQNEQYRRYRYVGYDSRSVMTSILSSPFRMPRSGDIILGNEYAILMRINTKNHSHSTVLGENSIEPYLFPPTVTANGLLLYNNASYSLKALQADDMSVKWELDLPDRLESAVSVYDGALFFVCADNYLYVYE